MEMYNLFGEFQPISEGYGHRSDNTEEQLNGGK